MASPARTGEAAVVVVGVAEQEAAVVEQQREEEEQAAAAVLLPVGMVMVQVFTAVTLLLSELALGAGAARPLVLLVYRNLVGAAAVAPLAVLFERGMMKKMNAVVCGWISINATFGVLLATGMYYYGLRDTNAAYSANFLNLIPIITFIIAVIFRAEKLAIASCAGKMKVLGTVLSVSGTMVVSLFRGQLLHLWPTHLLRLGSHAAAAAPPSSSSSSPAGTTISGTLLLCGSCLSYALWFIVQAKLAKVFPSKYWATVLTCLSGSLQALVAGVLTTGDWSEWKLSWDLRLLAVAYSGVFNTGITFVLISWAITRRGPIYPSIVIGALLIIVGLYAFLWGKGQELQLKASGVKQERHKAAGDDDPEI
uniref:WAT1-related protein n=1 Tax=Oryza barthii TaxID=65489 RepID=A0A0D3G6I9_9ORYZ